MSFREKSCSQCKNIYRARKWNRKTDDFVRTFVIVFLILFIPCWLVYSLHCAVNHAEEINRNEIVNIQQANN